MVSPQRIVARKSVVDHTGVQSADTTKLSLSRPPSAASSLSGGNTDLMSSSGQQVNEFNSFNYYSRKKFNDSYLYTNFDHDLKI